MTVSTSIASELAVGDVFTFAPLKDEPRVEVTEIFPESGPGLGILVRGKWTANGNPFSHRFLDPETDVVFTHHD